MGLENGAVQNQMIRVSSARDGNLNPPSARLNSPGAWVPSTNDKNQYIEVWGTFKHLIVSKVQATTTFQLIQTDQDYFLWAGGGIKVTGKHSPGWPRITNCL